MIDAVTSEVEDLTTKICRLEEMAAQLRLENEFFRLHAGEDLINRCQEQVAPKSQVFMSHQSRKEIIENENLPMSRKLSENRNSLEDVGGKSSDSEFDKSDKCLSDSTNE